MLRILKLSTIIFCLLISFCSFGQDKKIPWKPLGLSGLSGGGGMFTPGISPVDPDLMMINCDMSGAYISENGGRDWRMINCNQHRSSTRCYPAFHPKDFSVNPKDSRDINTMITNNETPHIVEAVKNILPMEENCNGSPRSTIINRLIWGCC